MLVNEYFPIAHFIIDIEISQLFICFVPVLLILYTLFLLCSYYFNVADCILIIELTVRLCTPIHYNLRYLYTQPLVCNAFTIEAFYMQFYYLNLMFVCLLPETHVMIVLTFTLLLVVFLLF